jgi:hypothetical protein
MLITESLVLWASMLLAYFYKNTHYKFIENEIND